MKNIMFATIITISCHNILFNLWLLYIQTYLKLWNKIDIETFEIALNSAKTTSQHSLPNALLRDENRPL